MNMESKPWRAISYDVASGLCILFPLLRFHSASLAVAVAALGSFGMVAHTVSTEKL